MDQIKTIFLSRYPKGGPKVIEFLESDDGRKKILFLLNMQVQKYCEEEQDEKVIGDFVKWYTRFDEE